MPRPQLTTLAWTLLLLGGCTFPVKQSVDHRIGDLAAKPLDLTPPCEVLPPTPPAKEDIGKPAGSTDATPPVVDINVQPAAAQDAKLPPPRLISDRLPVPPELPGGATPSIKLPDDPKERKAALERLYPPAPPVGDDLEPAPGPDGKPLSLAQLQLLGTTNSPLIRQAAADVEAARGAAVQAGTYPNPMAGYEGDQIGSVGRPGQQGIFIEQLIKTGGKLHLAQAAALMDVRNAEIALQRAHIDLSTRIRAGYFAVLVAQENVRVSRSLVRFTDEIHHIQVEQVKGAQAAPYEPLQLRVLAFQARGQLVQARNRHISAWKQLASTLGLPAMPPTQLEGRADMPIPCYRYDELLAHILDHHTEVVTARTAILKARYALRLAQVQPVPDVTVGFTVQKDFGGTPSLMQSNVIVGVPVPVWDKNRGGIAQAQGQLLRAVEEEQRVRNDLTARLAEAFERYDNNRQQLEFYRDRILPDQVRTYRGVFERHQQEPEKVTFGDVVTAQQTLAATATAYIATLGQMWIAVVDVANLLQTRDLFRMDCAGEGVPGGDG